MLQLSLPIANHRTSPTGAPGPRTLRVAVALVLVMASLGVTGLIAPLQADDPTDPVAQALAQGETLLADGSFAAAESLYRNLMQTAPGLADAHDGLARALAGQGRTREAGNLLLRLGRGWLDRGAYPEAVDTLGRAAGFLDASAEAHGLLGRALLLTKAFAEGLEHLRRARQLGDRSPRLLTYLGSALWENGELDAAAATLEQAARAGSGPAGRQLARLLLWRGRAEEALPLLEALVEARPSIDLRLDLARALEGVGRTDDAEGVYRGILAVDADQIQARYRRARLLLRLGRREEGAAEMAAYRELYQRQTQETRAEGLLRARLDRGWELLRQGDSEQAALLFADLPPTAEALQGQGLAWSAAGRHRKAAQALERALALNPERDDLRLRLIEERLAAEDGP